MTTWASLMPLPTNGSKRSTRLTDEENGVWEVAAKTIKGRDDLLRLRIWHYRDDGPDEWAAIVLDEEMNLVSLSVDDRENKAFEETEKVLRHKQLID